MKLSMVRRTIFALLLSLAATAAPLPVYAQDDPYAELMAAINNEDLPAVKDLIGRGMGVDTVDKTGSTLLMLASRAGSQGIVTYLIKAGAKVNSRNQFGDTALMWAALEGHLAICRMLVEQGAEFDHEGWNPLHYAALRGHDDVVEYLLSLDGDIDATSANGTTPLMMAAQEGHSETVKLLIAHKAELNLRNQAGYTALSWALKKDKSDVVEVLEDAGAIK